MQPGDAAQRFFVLPYPADPRAGRARAVGPDCANGRRVPYPAAAAAGHDGRAGNGRGKLCAPRTAATAALQQQRTPFVPLVSQIRVVTDDLLAYGETAARFRREYGLSLLLTPDDADVSQSNLLIAADAADVPLMFEGVIFTNRPQPRMNATVLMPEPPTLPPDFDALCPPDVDPLQFAAAAYELCAADTLGDLWSPMKEPSAVNSF